jgi:hypothetical protein
MIIVHIVAYLALIIVGFAAYVGFYKDALSAYEILTMCNLAVISLCTVIFGVIVN